MGSKISISNRCAHRVALNAFVEQEIGVAQPLAAG